LATANNLFLLYMKMMWRVLLPGHLINPAETEFTIWLRPKKNMDYLQAVVTEYEKPSTDDLAYRIARRDAHLADNELAQAWNSMRQEPKSKQKTFRRLTKGFIISDCTMISIVADQQQQVIFLLRYQYISRSF